MTDVRAHIEHVYLPAARTKIKDPPLQALFAVGAHIVRHIEASSAEHESGSANDLPPTQCEAREVRSGCTEFANCKHIGPSKTFQCRATTERMHRAREALSLSTVSSRIALWLNDDRTDMAKAGSPFTRAMIPLARRNAILSLKHSS
jgi:hypothetical protein